MELPLYGDREVMLKDHAVTTDLYKNLVDIRFKLLAFVPTVTTIAVGILSPTNQSGNVELGTMLLVGTGGLIASLAIVVYEIRNSQIHDRAIHRIKHLEKLLGFTPSYRGQAPRGMFEERGQGGQFLGLFAVKHDRALSMIYGIVLALWTWLVVRGLGDFVGWAGTQNHGRDVVIRAGVAALVGLATAFEITRQGGMGREPPLIYTLGDIVPEAGGADATYSQKDDGETIWRALRKVQHHAEAPLSLHDLLYQVNMEMFNNKHHARATKLVGLAMASGMVADYQRRWPPWIAGKGRNHALKVKSLPIAWPGESLVQALVGGQEIFAALQPGRPSFGANSYMSQKDLIVARNKLTRRFGADAPWCSSDEIRLRRELLTAALDDLRKSEKDMNSSANEDNRSTDNYLELWKHHAAFGGEDKNRMVVIASLFLGFSAAILVFVASPPSGGGSWSFSTEPWRTIMFSSLGIIISGVAGCLVLMYAGYANRNWQMADDIAETQGWKELLPLETNTPKRDDGSRVRGLVSISYRLSPPCRPNKELAPIFIVFLLIFLASLLLHSAILILAIVSFNP